jgi:hypothetical protein
MATRLTIDATSFADEIHRRSRGAAFDAKQGDGFRERAQAILRAGSPGQARIRRFVIVSNEAIVRYNPDAVWPVPEGFRSIYAHGVELRSNARLLFVSG